MHTAWDLGHQSNMAIWCFQIGDNGLLVHDFISESGWFFLNYIAELNKRGYYGMDFVPHDISAASFETGRTRVETLAAAGRKPVPVPRGNIEDRINASQLVLPKCRFNSTRCEQGLAALREFRRDWDDKQKVFKDSPRHDWASHAADAFTYLAMGWRQTAKMEPAPRPPLYKPLSAMSYDELDDEIEITYNGTKIIQAERRPRRPDRV
jgi:phage terminase large subunit